jgi:hypothetical protein
MGDEDEGWVDAINSASERNCFGLGQRLAAVRGIPVVEVACGEITIDVHAICVLTCSSAAAVRVDVFDDRQCDSVDKPRRDERRRQFSRGERTLWLVTVYASDKQNFARTVAYGEFTDWCALDGHTNHFPTRYGGRY